VTGPLSDITVIDLTRVLAGPFCTMMLAELGARVIKVEEPGKGDDSRAFAPFYKGQSAYFQSLNRDKESIALNLKDDADREIFLKLIGRGDVLVENYRPGTLDRLGLGFERLRQANDRLIYAAVSGFGDTGPWRTKPAYDMIVQAMSGIMTITGQPGSPPTKAGTSIGDITGGLFLLAGITTALHHRARTGQGLKVDVSMFDGQIAILESAILRYVTTGVAPGQLGNRHPSIAPFEAFETADRPLIIAVGNDAIFQRLCQALGTPDLLADPRFATNAARVANMATLNLALEAILRTKSAAHWLKELEAAGVPCSLIHTVADAVEHPQVQARNMIVTADGLRMAGNPIKLSGFAERSTRQPAPALDADRASIRRELGKP
jgi:CoA:oxalate CoA-transferase